MKSCRHGGSVQLSDGLVDIRDQECWLDNVHISEHGRTGRFDQHAVKRSRKLLLTKKEILKLEQRIIQKNYFIIPVRMFFSDKSFVKVELGIGPTKTIGDKRDDVMKREGDREIRRVLKNNYD